MHAKYLEKYGMALRLETVLQTHENGITVLSDETDIKTNCLIWAAGLQLHF